MNKLLSRKGSKKETSTGKLMPRMLVPVVGETIPFLTDMNEFVRKRVEKFGPIFKTNLFTEPMVFVTDPEVAMLLFRKENIWVHGWWPKSTVTLLGLDTLPVAVGHEHGVQRALISPSFTPAMMDKVLPNITQTIRSTLSSWETNNPDGVIPDFRHAVKEMAFEIVYDALFKHPNAGEDIHKDEIVAHFANFLEGLFSFPVDLPFTAYGRAIKSRQRIAELLREKVEAMDTGDTVVEDADDESDTLLQRMARSRHPDTADTMTVDQLVDAAVTMIFAGQDTTTTSLVNVMLLLTHRPEITDKLRSEQRALHAKYGAEYSWKGLKEMEYLDATLHELLQVVPVIGHPFRKAIVDFTLPGYDIQIKKGQLLVASIQGMHHHHDPARATIPMEQKILQEIDVEATFARQQANEADSRAYAPFGAGKRQCIGKNFATSVIKVFVSELLRKFEFGYPLETFPAWTFKIMPLPLNDFPIRLMKLRASQRIASSDAVAKEGPDQSTTVEE